MALIRALLVTIVLAGLLAALGHVAPANDMASIWLLFACYLVGTLLPSFWLSKPRYRLLIALLACTLAFAIEVGHLYWPRPREIIDFQSANLIAAWFGIFVAASWASVIAARQSR